MALYRNCHHVVALNTPALRQLGLLDPANGAGFKPMLDLLQRPNAKDFILFDENDPSAPTGVLQESATFLVKRFLYERTSDDTIHRYFMRGLWECLRRGVTAVQSNDFYSAWSVYQSIHVPIRVYLTVPFDEIVGMHTVEEGYKRHDEVGTPLPDDECGLVSCHRIKLFADGSLGAKTAALREPYGDEIPHDKCQHGHGCLIDSFEVNLVLRVHFNCSNC
jgi:hypothetical protein